MSALDPQSGFALSVFPNVRDVSGESARLVPLQNPGDFRSMFGGTPLVTRRKDAAELYVRGRCDGERRRENISPPYLVVLDVDQTDVSPEACSARLSAIGVPHLLHNTWSHEPDSPRYRVVTTYVVTNQAEMRIVVDALFRELSMTPTPESRSVSTGFYRPSVRPGNEERHTVIDRLDIADRWACPDLEPPHTERLGVDAQRDCSGLAFDLDEVRSALASVPNDDRAVWIEIGMALHSSGEETAFRIFDEWSAGQDYHSYSREACKEAWRSFKKTSDGIMLGTLFHKARENRWRPPRPTPQEDFAEVLHGAAAPPGALNEADGDEAEFRRLAALPRVEYDRERHATANRLDIRVKTLDDAVDERRPQSSESERGGSTVLFADIEPWPNPVDGALLLDELAARFSRFLALPEHAADAMALWVVHVHAHDAAQVSPVLAFVSPEKRCGKTTALSVMQDLVPRALPVANITSAALFRSIEQWSPTLLIDEADTFLKHSDELRGILNSGHGRRQAFVLRTVGDDHQPQMFRTWAPKAIALIGALPSTLEDRSIVIAMRRRLPNERVSRFRADRDRDTDNAARRCARWAADNMDTLREIDPKVPSELHDRAADNWRPLLAIAEEAGGEWPRRARSAALSLTPREDEGSASVGLLADVCALFDDQPDPDRISSQDLCEALINLEERPWGEWRRGKPLTPNSLARLLKPFGIRSTKLRFGSVTRNGYTRADFTDAFSRYLHDAPDVADRSGAPEQVDDSSCERDDTARAARRGVPGAARSSLLD